MHAFKIWQPVCVWPLCDGCWSIFLHSPCSASQRRWGCVWKALDCWINWRNWKSCFVQSSWKPGSQDNVCFLSPDPSIASLYLGFWMVLSSDYILQTEWQCDREESDPESFFFFTYIYKQFLQDSVLCIQSLCQTSKKYEFLGQWYKHWISSLGCLLDGL